MDISKLSKEEKAELLRKLKEEEKNRVHSAERNLRSIEASIHVRCGK